MPYAAAGAAALLVAYLLASSSSASQSQMMFKDYAWITYLPSGLVTAAYQSGGSYGGPIANPPGLAPPPGQSAASGNWHVYPGGMAFLTKSDGSLEQFTAWPSCPPGYDVYMWIPTTRANPPTPALVNGYWIQSWSSHISLSPQDAAAAFAAVGVSPPPPVAAHASPSYPIYTVAGYPPPPPGANPSQGHWAMKHPGYMVWLTPQNVSATDPELGATYTGAALTGTPTTTPSGAAVPPPSPSPIATTPAPAG